MKSIDNYTVTHLHTQLSNGTTNIDSVTTYEEYIERAEELGMKSIAFTEHGNMFGWVKKKQTCEKHGLKYIHGMECYVTETLDEKVRDNYHCCLYALNWEGVKELNKMSSISFQADHKYYSPRITFEELINTSDNIAIASACISGILGKGSEELKREYLEFMSRNRHRCFLEVQHHNAEAQKVLNKQLIEYAMEYDIRIIAGTDTHCLNADHIKGRDILQKAKNIYFDDEEGWDLTFKTIDELYEAFQVQDVLSEEYITQALQSTNDLADMVEEFELDYSYKYPHLWENPLELFKKKIVAGVKRRGVHKYPNYKEYQDRIKYELQAYIHNDAIDFMLLMEDIIDWCTHNGIKVGYGRGSVNGSVIAWLLGITEMDSIKHQLNFDRFMNTERISLSDIDTDFPPSDRDRVKDYIFAKAGLYCCDIITFNTVALKGSIRDVGRALEMEQFKIDNICKSVESNESELRKEYPILFEYVDIINGTIVSVGSHPCGALVSPIDVGETIGTFTTSTSNYPISQANMKEVDSLNYVKLDLLGLDNIEIINDTCKLAGIERLTPDNVDVDDDAVWDSIRDDTTQIFQWEGQTGNDYIKKLLSPTTIESFKKINPDVQRMDLLSIGNSAIRPAGSSYRNELGRGEFRDSGSPVLNHFLSNTYSFLVYQEQIITFLHMYCGFTMGEADVVRRGFAKKTGTEKFIPIIKYGGYLDEDNKTHYIEGFVACMNREYNMTQEEAETTIVNFIQVIEDASKYLFSLNHSQPYSYTGYVAGYLRYYYPLEFLTSAFNVNAGDIPKTDKLIEYALTRDITVFSPRFRKSRGDCFFDKDTNTIYRGIGSLKYFNNTVGEELYALKDGAYNNLFELLVDISEHTSCNSKHIDILSKINFFEEFGTQHQVLAYIDIFNTYITKKTISKKKMPDNLQGINLKLFATDTNDKGKELATWTIQDHKGLIDTIYNNTLVTADLKEILQWNYDHLGYLNYVNADLDKRVCFVMEVKGTGTRVVKVCRLATGEIAEVRVCKKVFISRPIRKGEVISMNEVREDFKDVALEKDEFDNVTKWGKDLDTLVWWLEDYQFVVFD